MEKPLPVAYFHLADGLSWLDALYFVVVTTATVGYGDINLLNASALSKFVGIALILSSTCFIWMIFSLIAIVFAFDVGVIINANMSLKGSVEFFNDLAVRACNEAQAGPVVIVKVVHCGLYGHMCDVFIIQREGGVF